MNTTKTIMFLIMGFVVFQLVLHSYYNYNDVSLNMYLEAHQYELEEVMVINNGDLPCPPFDLICGMKVQGLRVPTGEEAGNTYTLMHTCEDLENTYLWDNYQGETCDMVLYPATSWTGVSYQYSGVVRCYARVTHFFPKTSPGTESHYELSAKFPMGSSTTATEVKSFSLYTPSEPEPTCTAKYITSTYCADGTRGEDKPNDGNLYRDYRYSNCNVKSLKQTTCDYGCTQGTYGVCVEAPSLYSGSVIVTR